MGSIGRSFDIVGIAWRTLMKDKELLVLPMLSGILVLLLATGFVFGMNLHEGDASSRGGELTLPAIGWYLLTTIIVVFFQAAIVAGASERLAGGDPTIGSALGAAASRLLPIVMWGLIAGTVGLILRSLQNRNRGLGRFLIGMLGMAWALLTLFVVPVIVVERKGAAEAFKRSGALFKETWGESAVGRGSIGIVSFLCFLLLGAVVAALASAHQATAAIVLAIVGVAVLAVLFTALQAVWVAALYRYATAKEIPERYGGAAVEHAFAPK